MNTAVWSRSHAEAHAGVRWVAGSLIAVGATFGVVVLAVSLSDAKPWISESVRASISTWAMLLSLN